MLWHDAALSQTLLVHVQVTHWHVCSCAHTLSWHKALRTHTYTMCSIFLHCTHAVFSKKAAPLSINPIGFSNNTHPRMETGAGGTYWFSPRLGRKGSSTVDPWRLLPSPPVPLALLLPLFWRMEGEPRFSSRLALCVTCSPPLPKGRQTQWGWKQPNKKNPQKTLALRPCSPKKTEKDSRRWKKMNEWFLALALLCTNTGRRGVCIRERERDRERGRREKEKRMGELDGACVGDKKTEQIKSDFGLKWAKQGRGVHE